MQSRSELPVGFIPTEIYEQVVKSMPIPCVDLVILNNKREVLMLKRKNEPAKGSWWFPGGRVHFNESRVDAVKRKLREECGLQGVINKEILTSDLILEHTHAITTAYEINVNSDIVTLDEQSSDFAWKTVADWKGIIKQDFLLMVLNGI